MQSQNNLLPSFCIEYTLLFIPFLTPNFFLIFLTPSSGFSFMLIPSLQSQTQHYLQAPWHKHAHTLSLSPPRFSHTLSLTYRHVHTKDTTSSEQGWRHIGSVPPLCLCRMDLSSSPVLCLACTLYCWRGCSAWLLASLWTQILWLALSKDCTWTLNTSIFVKSLFFCLVCDFHNRCETECIKRSCVTADSVLGRLKVLRVKAVVGMVWQKTRGQVEVKRLEDRQAQSRQRLWVVAWWKRREDDAAQLM